jgi:amino acid adenylation domain-containing protein
MSSFAERIAALSPEQRKLLELRLKREGAAAPGQQPIPRRNPDLPIPLSFSQQRLWFIEQLEPGNPAYNMVAAIRITGQADIAALKASLNEIVRRHESLRTIFVAEDGRPVQRILPSLDLPLPTIDLRSGPPAEREQRAKALVVAEAQQPFDLASGPLIRAMLFQLDQQAYVLTVIKHHIISDGWSMNVLFRELGRLYEAFANGQPVPLPPLNVQYPDFAIWQRDLLAQGAPGATLADQLAYWKRQLAGVSPALDLPTDRARPTMQSFRGAHFPFCLSLELTEALKALSQREDVTLFMLLLAGFQVLLQRYSGQDDISVGSPIAGRPRRELEELIGFFVNTLVLRTDLSGNPSFREVLRRVRAVALGAYDHSAVPFEKLVDELQPERNLSRMPLFQVMFGLQNMPLSSVSLPGLTFEMLAADNETAKFDLWLSMDESQVHLAGVLEYNTDLFDQATIARMIGHFETLLAGVAKDPEQRIADLPLLTTAERHQLLIEWNATAAAFPVGMCLHQQFEARAAEMPDAPAVVYEDVELSYAALNRRANQLAHQLRSLGVGPDTAVGICMERSLEMVIGLQAILKAGGAYMPLDPAYPKDRLQFMLADAGASVLLTQERLLDVLPEHSAQVICIDRDWNVITEEPDDNPQSGVTVDNLSYIIYTSGSTGAPKGVMLDHRGRVNNFHDFNTRFAIGPGDRLIALASLSFDMCAYDVFGTLAAGGTIVIPIAALERDPAHWAELMIRHQVTIWHSVPALLEMLVEYVAAQPQLHPHALRLVLLGGDWIPVSLPDRLRAIVAGVQVISMGGATEASMDSTIYEIVATDPAWKSIPYGKPMVNQSAYVLDAQLQPVPIGVPGELYLGGIGVAWGYFNRPNLTAERFIPNALSHPAGTQPGDRLYRTGDLARFRPDGNLELLGRIDHQVKIRGLRIELGEIEAALRRHPGVHECVIVARAQQSGVKRLVAYVVGEQPGNGAAEQASVADQDRSSCSALCSAHELREFLHDHLPDYMVPSAFVLLPALPLTPNGKIDRRNLPDPDQADVVGSTTYAAPTTATEQALAQIWSALLGTEQAGIHDNFFALGGDSILSIQVVARARQAGILITPKLLFQHQTIAALAAVAEAAASEAPATNSALAQLSAEQRERLQARYPALEDAYPVSPMQANMLLQSRCRPQPGLYVIQRSFPLPSNLDIAALERAWQTIIDRHPILRTTFVCEGLDEPLQLVHRHLHVTIEQHDWRAYALDQQEARLDQLFHAARMSGFDLETLPLLRLAVIRLADHAYQFVMINHYLLIDGWTEQQLRKEVLLCYAAFAQQQPIDLPPSRPYRDYIAWVRQQDLPGAEAFWRQALAEAPAATSLARKSVHIDDAQVYRKQGRVLSAATTAALQSIARSRQLTLNILVQGAWALLLGHHSRAQDVIFGVTFSGRPAALDGVETMVGLFINTLPVQVHVAPQALLLPWLEALQHRQAEAQQYEYYPLPELVKCGGLEPGSLLFESILVFANYPLDTALRTFGATLDLSHPIAQQDHGLAQTEFPLRVDVTAGHEITLSLSYYRHCFDDPTIAALLAEFQELLEAIAAQPDRPLAAFG